jgi:ferredoxin-type protein NapH
VKKRQRLRKGLIIISFLFFPITLYYFSPALIIEGASKGIITGSFIVFSLQTLTALYFGRAFCGWACPGAGLQEACFPARDRKVRGGKLNWIKYFVWVPWIGLITFFAVKAGGLRRIDPFFMTTHGISVADPTAYIVFYVVVGIVVVLALTAGRRAFCHYACWMAPFMIIGSKIRNIFEWPALHIKANKDKCASCKKCTRNCPMSLDVNKMVQSGLMRDDECILCGTCVDNCPNQVLSYSFRSGR